MNKIKINDKVLILSGKDKGKVGVVTKILNNCTKNNKKIIIEGINIFKKHVKANPNKNKPGGIISIEKPMPYSNVLLFCSDADKKSKIYFSFSENKRKNRFFKITKGVVN